MNTVMLNTVHLDGAPIIKKGSGGGGGVTINNQSKSVDIVENGTTEIVADSGYTGLGKVTVNVNVPSSGGGSDMPVIGDGKTYLYIKIAAKGRMDVPLCFSQTVANGVTIDWGDGSETQTLSGTGNVNTTHTYADIGDYTISLNPDSDCTLGLGRNSYPDCVMGSSTNKGMVYCSMLQAVEIGKNVTSIGESAFSGCSSLANAVIPDSVTSIGGSAFSSCSSLASIVIPSSVTSIGNNAFSGCYSLVNVVIPDGVTSIGESAFKSCYSLVNVVIPDSVTSIGDYTFSVCSSLASAVIPDSVTSIGNYAFNNCHSLASAVIPDSVTSIGNYAFSNCYSLANAVIPDSVTSIGSGVFTSCYSLVKVVIPDDVTSIGNGAFSSCSSLASIVIPSSVTSIGNNAFKTCYGMAFYDFRASKSVPTLGGTSVFSSIPSDCKIVVPDALYDEWISATNWTSHASKIIKASEFNG